jgi:hypothetical protein
MEYIGFRIVINLAHLCSIAFTLISMMFALANKVDCILPNILSCKSRTKYGHIVLINFEGFDSSLNALTAGSMEDSLLEMK